MQEVFLGEAIKRKRLELGLTQEQLCQGICEPITISRLENGKQTPSRNRINALPERLDMPSDRYSALLSSNELEIEALQKQIVAYNIQFSHANKSERPQIRQLALETHKKLEAVIEKDDMISRQLILRSKVIIGTENGSYSFDEQRAMLTEAIRLTAPHFDIDDIGRGLYSCDEVKIINQLALIHVYAGEHMEAIDTFSQLYKYIRKHFHNISNTRVILSMVAFNYARELVIIGQYENALTIAEEGRKACLDYGHYLSLPGLLNVMAESYHLLGNDEKSKDLYYQTYYLCKVIEDKHGLEIIRSDAKKYLHLEFEC